MVKQTAKRVLPKSLWAAAKEIRARYHSVQLAAYDRKRFRKYQARPAQVDPAQLGTVITFHAHAIEKGLSHQNLRLGFGREPLKALSTALGRWAKLGFDLNADCYRNGISVLGAYIRVHREQSFDLSGVRALLGPIFEIAEADTSMLGGVIEFPVKIKAQNASKPFRELFAGRYSVREYSDEPIDINVLSDVLQLCVKTPSVCNRQSARAHVITDANTIDSVLRLQGGFNGFRTPPALLAVTTDSRAFIEAKERNQPWIDGGLYAMSLLLALEASSFAACPLNAMMSKSQELKMRRLLGIEDYENMIMFIALGNFLPQNRAPKSYRERKFSPIREINQFSPPK